MASSGSTGPGIGREDRGLTQLDRLRANLPERANQLHGPGAGNAPDLALPVTSGDSAAAHRARELLVAVLDGMAAEYDAEGGDIIGVWENGIFDFSWLEDDEGRAEVLQVHGLWERVLPADRFQAAAVFANEWNAEHVWPKVFVQPDGDGWIGLHGEVTADLGDAPTVDRVDLIITTGIVAALSVFDAAERAFPDALAISDDDLGESE